MEIARVRSKCGAAQASEKSCGAMRVSNGEMQALIDQVGSCQPVQCRFVGSCAAATCWEQLPPARGHTRAT